MMERILLGVLCLSGWHIFSTCLLHQYHYVAHHMNWTEAQTYCREKYIDLATIESTEEMNQLNNTVSSFGYDSLIWIGLFSLIDWRWSDGYTGSGAEYRDWSYTETTFHHKDKYFCVMTGTNQSWLVYDCSSNRPFICNNGTQLDPEFVFVNEKKNWSSAQRYCRKNYRDLATVRNDTENQQVQNFLNGHMAWIGLFRDPDIYWSDGSGSSFKNLYTGFNDLIIVMCGTAYVKESTKWFYPCEGRYPFVCYSVPKSPAPVKRQVVKLRIKPGDSVDLNDDTVKANILKEFQKNLKDKGVTGVTLKWKKQPDGKVFHKEGKSPEEKKRKKTEL